MSHKNMRHRNNAVVESDQVIDAIIAKKGNKGTGKAIKKAVEQSDAEIARITQTETRGGTPRIDVWLKHGDIGAPGSVPKPLHDLLTGWGYVHTGEDLDDHNHMDSFGNHGYIKK